MDKYLTYIRKFEITLIQWFKPLPHFPVGFKKWLGENIWWIVLIGAIGSTISALVLISGFITLVSIVTGVATYAVWYLNSTYYTWWSLVIAFIHLVFAVVATILMWLAVGQLRDKKEYGWRLLFVIALVDAAGVIIADILNLSILDMIISLIGIAIGTYLIFEFRSEFVKEDVIRSRKTKRVRARK